MGFDGNQRLWILIFDDDYLENSNAAGQLYPPLQDLQTLDDNGDRLPAWNIKESTVKCAFNTRGFLNKREVKAVVYQNGRLNTGDPVT